MFCEADESERELSDPDPFVLCQQDTTKTVKANDGEMKRGKTDITHARSRDNARGALVIKTHLFLTASGSI